ncbi:MAG: SdpI family protein [Vicinamibacterales bacterium]
MSIPLILRWVPPNRFYGFRTPATLRSVSVWYDANALNGRHLLQLGFFMVALDFLLPGSARTPVLAAVGLAGLIAISVYDWRTASRWARERGGGGDLSRRS